MGDPKQVNQNIDAKKQNTYDAIVVGSGISGGLAAKELCEKGLKTLVLERGRNVEHIKDYPTASMHPWELENRNNYTQQERIENPVKTGFSTKADGLFFVNDK